MDACSRSSGSVNFGTCFGMETSAYSAVSDLGGVFPFVG